MQAAKLSTNRLSSNAVRKTFLDFFNVNHGHRIVRSSPVLPNNDPSLAFVNAGMNQFKGVLLGTALPPSGRVVNSQKCIRVGGKHNDLADVGKDGSHHTFFEMLGNWSFGNYFKKEACEMAWELLTKGYGLNGDQLHVTYFGGDEKLGLEADLETLEIWRQIGVPENRISPCGAQDNFWEMGDTGPCGGCTEIHYLPHGKDPSQLLELWNLVFIEYNREENGGLSRLACRHVDTGMGFERLVAVLQGKSSNYDTDLFWPLFDTIQKVAGSPPYKELYGNSDASKLNTSYRVLADHSRMIGVCLADGFFPDQEGKLRGIIRKALTISRDVFGKEVDLLKELSWVVAEILHDGYPEIGRNMKRVHHILNHEAELLYALRKDKLLKWKELSEMEPNLMVLPVNECPNLLPAYQKLKAVLVKGSEKCLDPALVWKICETYGVPAHLASALATALGKELDMVALESEITSSKMAARKEMYSQEQTKPWELSPNIIQELLNDGVPQTDDTHKHNYRNGYFEQLMFPDQSAGIVALVVDDDLLNYVSPDLMKVDDCQIGVILDRTNMYHEAGGQAADRGTIIVEDTMELQVEYVSCSAGYVVHWIKPINISTEGLRIYNQCIVKIDEEKRKSVMNNHTGTHILNAALREILTFTDQKSSNVTADKFRFDFSVYRESLSLEDLQKIEKFVRNVVKLGTPVRRRTVDSYSLGSFDRVVTLPGETYPYKNVHLIEIDGGTLLSREPCCGTHAVWTSDLQDFVIINFKSLSSCVKSIQAVTGSEAAIARKNAVLFQKNFKELQRKVDKIVLKPNRSKSDLGSQPNEVEDCDARVCDFIRQVKETELLSYVVSEELISSAEEMRTRLKYCARGSLRSSMEEEMKEVLAANQCNFFVHYLQCSSEIDSIPLQKASKLCGNMPSVIFAQSGGVFKARCCVPKGLVSETFSAQVWLEEVLRHLDAEGGPPRGQDPALVYNMKGKKLSFQSVERALELARDFAVENLKRF